MIEIIVEGMRHLFELAAVLFFFLLVGLSYAVGKAAFFEWMWARRSYRRKQRAAADYPTPRAGEWYSHCTTRGYQPTAVSKEEADWVGANPPSGGSSVMSPDKSGRN